MSQSAPTIWRLAAEQLIWAMGQGAAPGPDTADGLEMLEELLEEIEDEAAFKEAIARCFSHLGEGFPEECAVPVRERARQAVLLPKPVTH